jgi:hypothetical protein
MLFNQKPALPTAKLSGGAARKRNSSNGRKKLENYIRVRAAAPPTEKRAHGASRKTRAYFSLYLLITRNLMKSRAFLLLKFTEEASKEGLARSLAI